MSIKIMSHVWLNVKSLSATKKLILLKLADHANDDGVCWPSMNHIAEQCNMSRRNARNHCRALEQLGYIARKSRTTEQGRITSNYYQLTIDPVYRSISTDTHRSISTDTIEPPEGTPINTPSRKAQSVLTYLASNPDFQSECIASASDKLGDRAGDEYDIFIAHHEKTGSVYKSWPAAWRTWVLKEVKYRAERSQKATTPGKQPLTPVRNDGALREALAGGKKISMGPGSYNAPVSITDWAAVANWYNDLATKKGWPGRVHEVVKQNGYTQRV